MTGEYKTNEKREKFFYGWIIVLGGVLIGAAANLLNSISNVVVGPVTAEFDVPRAMFNVATVLSMPVVMILSPIAGRYFRKNPRKQVMILASVVFGAALFGCSMAANLYWFYVLIPIAGATTVFINNVPVSTIINNWFVDKKGLAIGIAGAGVPLASMVTTPLISWLAESAGCAGIVFAIALFPFFANSHIRRILAFLVFILGWFLYYVVFIEINEISTGSTIQDIRFYFYMCSPYVMLVLIWTELSRDNVGIGRTIKIIAIWFVLLLAMFLGEIKEKNKDTQVSTEKTDIIPAISATETNDTNIVARTLEESILSVYTVISDYMNTGKVLEFNTDDLWALYNNWNEIQKMKMFEKPIDMKTTNSVVEFYYDDGLGLVWDRYENTADIITVEHNCEEIVNNESGVDMEESELSQMLFNSINNALSIGATSNCDMSQENLKKLYEEIEDGSFFEQSLFTYITEYGKDRYNYEIGYDGLVLCVYYDSNEDLYGFDILEY